jgi:hypothetical protein
MCQERDGPAETECSASAGLVLLSSGIKILAPSAGSTTGP